MKAPMHASLGIDETLLVRFVGRLESSSGCCDVRLYGELRSGLGLLGVSRAGLADAVASTIGVETLREVKLATEPRSAVANGVAIGARLGNGAKVTCGGKYEDGAESMVGAASTDATGLSDINVSGDTAELGCNKSCDAVKLSWGADDPSEAKYVGVATPS